MGSAAVEGSGLSSWIWKVQFVRLPFSFCFIAFVALALGGCATTSKDIGSGIENLPSGDAGQGKTPPVENYRIGLQDELNITVFREPDLSLEEVVVDVSGNFGMPLLGQVKAFGKTPTELEQEIENGLNQRYLRDAQVAVSISKATSYTFSVEGEVKKPGTYAIPGRVTLLQSIAIGEGVTSRAQLSQVLVFRQIADQRFVARFDISDIRRGRAPDPELQSGDLVVVNYSVGKQIYQDLLAILPAVTGIFIAVQQVN